MSNVWKSFLARAGVVVTTGGAAVDRGAARYVTSAAAAAALLLSTALLGPAVARGAFPGTNGAIAYVVSAGNGISKLESSYLTGAPAGTPLMATGVDLGGDSFAPAWGPDGRTLAFASTRTGNTQIYTVQLGTAGQPLSAAPASPAGQPSPCGMEICRLTDDPWADSNPSWSPNGRELVFDSDRTGTGQHQIYTIDADGGEERCLVCDTADNTRPTWSSTGTIAFQSNRSGSPQIYTIDADGGEVRQITNQPGGSTDPAWSSDGEELAYTSGTPPNTQIFTIALGGGPPRQITHDLQGEDELPVWSPDGTEILVSHREPVSNTGYMYAVYTSSGGPVPNATVAGFEGSWASLPPPTASPASPSATPSPSAAAVPVPGKTAIARTLHGKVTVAPGLTAPAGTSLSAPSKTSPMGSALTAEPGQKVPPAPTAALRGQVEVPVDSTYNAAEGAVELQLTTVAAAKPSAALAVVAGGPFSVTQPHADATPRLQLLGRPRGCSRGLASAASRRYPPKIGGYTKNRWLGFGRRGHMSVKGTRWEIEETCRGTVYRAIEDDVTVTDPGRHRTIVLTAGHSYLVRSNGRPRRPGHR